MINSLLIRNYAIIEELEINFSKGLTIITGETGAGKSILLGALGLVMGKRADTKSLYHLDQKCVVEARFDISKYGLKPFFQENDLDYEDELLIRREISPSGKTRAFINDTPANLNTLQELSASLIDLHQQFDTLDIHQISFQLRMLDALADNKRLLEKYQEAFRQYQADCRRLQEMEERQRAVSNELEFFAYQMEEFLKAELVAGEQEQLEEELNTLTNAEDIKRTLSAVYQQLSEADLSVIGQLDELRLSLKDLSKVSSDIRKIYDRFQGFSEEMKDTAQECSRLAEATEYDPERIMMVQQRLDMIYRLQNKHQASSVEELLRIQESIQLQLSSIGDLSAEIEQLQGRTQQQEQELIAMAETLSEKRHAVIAGFENRVEHLLAQVAMEHAKLKVQVNRMLQLGSTGLDEVTFLFAANKGSRLQPIKDVASGGELSRLTLVIKSLVASAIPLPTLIFDEIDSGISGDVALKMGRILRHLSDEHQVVSITHSPQIASKADAHYFVYKRIADERTITKVRELKLEERIRAIATMLSQNPPSDSALENARELIEMS